jgi:hypothetical protein
VVDQLARDYAGGSVVFIEQKLGDNEGEREDRFWAAVPAGTYYFPYIDLDSGYAYQDGHQNYATYQALIEAELARAPQAAIDGHWQCTAGVCQFQVQVTNQSGVTLSSSNKARVYAIVYENEPPVQNGHVTSWLIRDIISTTISTLADGATAPFNLQTGTLTNVTNWNNTRAVVFAEYYHSSTHAYNMLQALMLYAPSRIALPLLMQ